jgi:hypothetical protein
MRPFRSFSTLDIERGRTPVVDSDPRRGAWTPIVMFVWLVGAWKIFEMLFALGASSGGFGTVTPRGVFVDLSRNVDPRRERICIVPVGAAGLSEETFEVISGASWGGSTHLLVHPDRSASFQTVIDGIELATRAARATGANAIVISLIDQSEWPAGDRTAPDPQCSHPRRMGARVAKPVR